MPRSLHLVGTTCAHAVHCPAWIFPAAKAVGDFRRLNRADRECVAKKAVTGGDIQSAGTFRERVTLYNAAHVRAVVIG